MIGVYDLFLLNARRFPGKKAVVDECSVYTYEDLNREVNRLSDGFSRMGYGKGSRIGLLLRNSASFTVALFALWKIGACVSLLNFRARAEELGRCLSVVGCDAVICEDDLVDLVVRAKLQGAQGSRLNRVKCMPLTAPTGEGPCTIASLAEQGSPDWLCAASLGENDEVLNIFTGGTTGEPKGAAHTQKGLFLQIAENFFDPDGFFESDVILTYAPLFHIGGLTMVLNALCRGGTAVLVSRFDADSIVRTMIEESVTQLLLIPPTIVECLRAECELEQEALRSVRIVRLAGGACSIETVKKVFDIMPSVEVSIGYGMSEHAVSMVHRFDRRMFEANPQLAFSVGRSCFLSEALVLDESGNEVEPGDWGEVYGRSECMAVRYLGTDKPLTCNGWFATGDIMRCDDEGRYFFLSRSKDMIKSGGENVYAIEVEDALLSHPKVAECAVIGLPDDVYGELVTAAIVVRGNAEAPSFQELTEHCAGIISGYKKPRWFCFLGELPKTSIGKVDKLALKERMAERFRASGQSEMQKPSGWLHRDDTA